MSESTDPANPTPSNPPNPSPTPAPDPVPKPATSQPKPSSAAPVERSLPQLIDALLKRPAALITEFCHPDAPRAWLPLMGVALASFAFYGFLMGTFSGGPQIVSSAVKVGGGALLGALICFPSLYIFSCLSGADATVRGVAGVLFSILTLTGLLLLGFAPVAWVFSQSTGSVTFIGFLHLVFWGVGTWFGLRLLEHFSHALRVVDRAHLHVWAAIFVLVCLQMTTALRPLVGTANTWLPTEKQFFLQHWLDGVLPSDVPNR